MLLAALFTGAALIEGVNLASGATPAPSPRPPASYPGARSAPPSKVVETGGPRPSPVLHFLKLSPQAAYLKNAAIPDSRITDSPASPFYLATAAPADGPLSSRCLAQAVYYEAASESLDGQRAVAQVVLNRVRDRRFPKTVCGVVFEGSGLRTGCQFSFTCDGSLNRVPSPAAWLVAQAVADAALRGDVMKAIGHATHYHTVWVTPYWGAGLTKWGRLGAHIFYRWAGGGPPVAIGLRPAFGVAARPQGAPAIDRLEPIEVARAMSVIVEPAPAARPVPSSAPPAAAWPPPSGWPPAAPSAGPAIPANPAGVLDAPYQTVRSRGGLDGPHFAARDHR